MISGDERWQPWRLWWIWQPHLYNLLAGLPRWSPDGRYIVASTTRPDYQALMLFDFRTQKWAELARNLNGFTNWSRDGQWVYVLGPWRDPAVLRVRASDHHVEVAASVKDLRVTGAAGGFWTATASDGSPLVLRDTGTSEIYALDWKPR